MARDATAAFEWVERATAGKIIERVEHARWRPQWFLTVRAASGETREFVLRGYRNAGLVESEIASRERLRREAGVLAALQNTPVKVPGYLGYAPCGDWFLMERVAGAELLTEVKDEALQAAIFRSYLDNVALLHKMNPADLDLPATLGRPVNAEDCATGAYCMGEKAFRAGSAGPDPLYEIALSWLHRNRPAPVSTFSLCTGDIGANQFFFDAGALRSIFDLEMSYIGDPLRDVGLMRYRNLCYPIAKFADGVRHYLQQMDRRNDAASLDYWTVIGLLGVSLNYAALRERPDPAKPADMSLMLAMSPRRRGLAEVLHHIHGLVVPERPARIVALEDSFTKYFDFVVEAIRQHYVPCAPGDAKYAFETLGPLVDVLRGCHALGAQIAAENGNDLSDALGYRADGERAALSSLAEQVRADPENNLARILRALYRIEARNEDLLEPVIRACGFAVAVPLEQIYPVAHP